MAITNVLTTDTFEQWRVKANANDGDLNTRLSAQEALRGVNLFVATSQAAQLALSTQEGDVVSRTDIGIAFIKTNGNAGTMADWLDVTKVATVAGRSGDVVLVSTDITDFNAAVDNRAASLAIALG